MIKPVQVFLYRFVHHPDKPNLYEIELRKDGLNSRGKITKEQYEHLKGDAEEQPFPRANFYVLIEPTE